MLKRGKDSNLERSVSTALRVGLSSLTLLSVNPTVSLAQNQNTPEIVYDKEFTREQTEKYLESCINWYTGTPMTAFYDRTFITYSNALGILKPVCGVRIRAGAINVKEKSLNLSINMVKTKGGADWNNLNMGQVVIATVTPADLYMWCSHQGCLVKRLRGDLAQKFNFENAYLTNGAELATDIGKEGERTVSKIIEIPISAANMGIFTFEKLKQLDALQRLEGYFGMKHRDPIRMTEEQTAWIYYPFDECNYLAREFQFRWKRATAVSTSESHNNPYHIFVCIGTGKTFCNFMPDKPLFLVPNRLGCAILQEGGYVQQVIDIPVNFSELAQ